jgi:hypothetical protein
MAPGSIFLPNLLPKIREIHQNFKSKMEGLLASIFDGFHVFWEASWGGKSNQEPSKIAPKKTMKKFPYKTIKNNKITKRVKVTKKKQ